MFVAMKPIPKLQLFRRPDVKSVPISVQCLRCRSMDTLYANTKDGKIVSWDYDRNYFVTQRAIHHSCGGMCKAFYPGSINQF